MQRLQDIVQADLSRIVNDFADFTRSIKIQAGGIVHTVMASLQGDTIDFTADASPLNAYSVTLYYIDLDDDTFNHCIKKNAIIFVDGVSYRIVDTMESMGLRSISLERHGGR